MIPAKRYHPLLMLFGLWSLLKNNFFIFIFLFVIKARSQSPFIIYGRILFFIVFGVAFIYIFLKWFAHKYELDGRSFHLYKGIFIKSERTIPFSKIQNVNRHTSLFHRLFKVTSISFETGMTGEEAAVKFEVVSQLESLRMEQHITSEVNDNAMNLSPSEMVVAKVDSIRIIHFKPMKKDILNASFTSLSFLVFIPLLLSFYSKIDEILHVEKETAGIFFYIISSWWIVTTIVVVLIMASVAFGIARAFIKYGKYEISSDRNRIYITKGVIDETAFSIAKEKVQAIEIKQSILKRLLGLAEVKLTCAGSLSFGEETLEINSLYPFLPVQRAYEMVSEILPTYEVTPKMKRLPKKSLWVRLFSPSWIWVITTAVLFYFRPAVLGVEQAWWIVSAALLLMIIAIRWLDFIHTKYILNNRFIQYKTGSLTTSLFISKREKVIEVKVTRTIFQKWLGLASIETINRAKPLQHNGIEDVPVEFADSFYKWYMGRRNEIEIE
ncbi:PH domain-containing protein [Neobacillus novalis]|uniref:PH domain-containing protein n=1 Tax=Neobacillus novalis TaxID=220687 RepID=A0AA95MRF1_9BACI|nr:PH domain-containing protein [Neobacillus novalis]WHY86618.1 PH domain-containing protein [Neobacillus novalis]